MITVSLRIYKQVWTAHIPQFGSNVIFKYVVTQCKTCITTTPTPTFILIWLETLCMYTCEDTVYMKIHGHSVILKCASTRNEEQSYEINTPDRIFTACGVIRRLMLLNNSFFVLSSSSHSSSTSGFLQVRFFC